MSETVSNYDARAAGTPKIVPVFDPESPLMQSVSLAARIFLGGLMLVYGAEKLTILNQFAENIYLYQLLPMSVVNIAALLFVWAEITVGILLISGAAVRGSALVSAALLLVFIVAVGSAMIRGLVIDCGCFKPTPQHPAEIVGWPKIFEDLAYLGVAVFLVYFPHSWFSIDRILRRASS